MVSLFGSAVSYLLFASANSLSTIFLARVIAGVMDGNVSVIQAALADQSSAEDRARVYGVATSAYALGFVVGPALGALLPTGLIGVGFWPGIVAAVACSFALLAGHFWYHDIAGTRAIAKVSDTTSDISSLGAPRTILSRNELMLLKTSTAFAQAGLIAITGFWTDKAFGWGSYPTSMLYLWICFNVVVVQLLGLPRSVGLFGETASLFIGAAAACLALVLIVLARQSETAFTLLLPVPLCGIAIVLALVNSLLSKVSSQEEVGHVLGTSEGMRQLEGFWDQLYLDSCSPGSNRLLRSCLRRC